MKTSKSNNFTVKVYVSLNKDGIAEYTHTDLIEEWTEEVQEPVETKPANDKP
jgi:hypothetical protein